MWNADNNQGDAGLHRYHHPEHPRAVRLRRRLKRGLRQPAEDEALAGRISGALNDTGDLPVIKRDRYDCLLRSQ